MIATQNEIDAIVHAIPNDLQVTSPKFMINENGFDIVCHMVTPDPEKMQISLTIGNEEVELTKFQRALLGTAIYYKVQLI